MAAIFCALVPTLAAAQDPPRDTVVLSDIVVTATRLPMPRSSVASTVTVIQGEDLRSQGIHYVADALRVVPGMAVAQNGSFGAVTAAFIRGGESDYLQVMVDGVQVNGAGGTFDFANLTTENIERIEVVSGPGSVLYGSDAVSGVVQVFTRQGRGRATVDAAVSAGSYGTWSMDAGLQGAANALDYSVSVSRLSTDGVHAFNSQHRSIAPRASVADFTPGQTPTPMRR
jgi:vitamin B12 transporter